MAFKNGHDDFVLLQDEWNVIAVVSFCRLLLLIFVFNKMQIALTFLFCSDKCRLSFNVVVIVVVCICDLFIGNEVWIDKQTF